MKFLPTRSHCWNQCPWRSRKLERCCPISSVISYQVKRTRIILFKEARLHFLGKNLPVQSVRDLWVGISNVDHNVTNSVHLWPIYQFEIKGKVYWDWDWNWGVRTFKLNAWGSEADVVTANCKNVKIANKEIQNTSRPTSLQFLLEPPFLFSEPTASTSTKLTFSQQVAFICFNPQSILSHLVICTRMIIANRLVTYN